MEIVCDLFDEAVVTFPVNFRKEYVIPLNVYGWKSSRQEAERQDACGAAKLAGDERFAKVDGVDFGIQIKLLRVPVLCGLTDGFYEPNVG